MPCYTPAKISDAPKINVRDDTGNVSVSKLVEAAALIAADGCASIKRLFDDSVIEAYATHPTLAEHVEKVITSHELKEYMKNSMGLRDTWKEVYAQAQAQNRGKTAMDFVIEYATMLNRGETVPARDVMINALLYDAAKGSVHTPNLIKLIKDPTRSYDGAAEDAAKDDDDAAEGLDKLSAALDTLEAAMRAALSLSAPASKTTTTTTEELRRGQAWSGIGSAWHKLSSSSENNTKCAVANAEEASLSAAPDLLAMRERCGRLWEAAVRAYSEIMAEREEAEPEEARRILRTAQAPSSNPVIGGEFWAGFPPHYDITEAIADSAYPSLQAVCETGMHEILQGGDAAKAATVVEWMQETFVCVTTNEALIFVAEGRGKTQNNMHKDSSASRMRQHAAMLARARAELPEGIDGGAAPLVPGGGNMQAKVAIPTGGVTASGICPDAQNGFVSIAGDHLPPQFHKARVGDVVECPDGRTGKVLNVIDVKPKKRKCPEQDRPGTEAKKPQAYKEAEVRLATPSPGEIVRVPHDRLIVTELSSVIEDVSGGGSVTRHWGKLEDLELTLEGMKYVMLNVVHYTSDPSANPLNFFVWAAMNAESRDPLKWGQHGAVAPRNGKSHQGPPRQEVVVGCQVVTKALLCEDADALSALTAAVYEWWSGSGGCHTFLAKSNRPPNVINGRALKSNVLTPVQLHALRSLRIKDPSNRPGATLEFRHWQVRVNPLAGEEPLCRKEWVKAHTKTVRQFVATGTMPAGTEADVARAIRRTVHPFRWACK